MDMQWWNAHRAEVQRMFHGEQHSSSARAGVQLTRLLPCGNSGAGAIALAERFGAARVVLLGYDCQFSGDKRHWHGDHPAGLGNAGSLHRWPGQFSALAARLSVPVINCSAATALTCFPRQPLRETLA